MNDATRDDSFGAALLNLPRWQRLGLLILGVLAVIAVFQLIDSRTWATPVPVNVADLERQFDDDPHAAMEHYASGPLLVTGKVASVHSDRITFESINILNVQAYFSGTTLGLTQGSMVTLRCATLYEQEYLTGSKPAFRNCWNL